MELDAELTKLRSLAGSGESSLLLERAAQQQLTRQIKALEIENATLKEDLAFFEGLMLASKAGDELGARIENLKVEPSGTLGEHRYRMLVINSGGRQAKELKGSLQILVKVQEGGKDANITFPSATEPNPQRFRLEIKHFQRIEGVFSVPSGAVVKEVEVRLLQDGSLRARQSVTL